MPFSKQELQHFAQEAKIQSKQLKELSMHFESITDIELRDKIIYFMERVGEFAGMEINHGAIGKTLMSDEVFDMMVGEGD